MAGTAESQATLPTIRPEDCKDPQVLANRLNSIFGIIAPQIGALQGASGTIELKNDVRGVSFEQTANADQIPTAPGSLTTLSVVQQLIKRALG